MILEEIKKSIDDNFLEIKEEELSGFFIIISYDRCNDYEKYRCATTFSDQQVIFNIITILESNSIINSKITEHILNKLPLELYKGIKF